MYILYTCALNRVTIMLGTRTRIKLHVHVKDRGEVKLCTLESTADLIMVLMFIFIAVCPK